MKNVNIINHPVIQHKLTVLRDRTTTPLSFRLICDEISQLLAFEVSRELKTKKLPIQTPLESTEGVEIAENVAIVAIMRAGNGMLQGMLRTLPFATVGHIGIYRDRFIQSTVEYYLRLPKNIKGAHVFLLDPLLASGDTAVAAIDRLKENEVGAIHFISFLAAPEGLEKIAAIHPEVKVTTLSIERELNSSGFILPGIGDAGERLYDHMI